MIKLVKSASLKDPVIHIQEVKCVYKHQEKVTLNKYFKRLVCFAYQINSFILLLTRVILLYSYSDTLWVYPLTTFKSDAEWSDDCCAICIWIMRTTLWFNINICQLFIRKTVNILTHNIDYTIIVASYNSRYLGIINLLFTSWPFNKCI